MKKLLFSFLALVSCLPVLMAQTYVIGSGTTFNGQYTYPAPYGNGYEGARHQFLYTAAELTAAGATADTFYQFGFNVQSTNGAAPHQNFTILMKNSNTTDLTSWETGLTQVFTTPAYTPVVGINLHTLNTPFYWDGTSNIVVEVCFNNSGYFSNAFTFWTTGLPFTASYWYREDEQGVCANTSVTSSGTTRPNGYFVIPQNVDMEATAFLSPGIACVYSASEPVSFSFSNSGTQAQTNFTVAYSINGGTPVSETYSGTVLPGASGMHTFATNANLSALGVYQIAIWVEAAGDANNSNDTVWRTVEHIGVVSSFPYLQDFESGPGNWFSTGTNNSWAFGTPAKTTINSAGSGVNSWVTGGLGTTQYNNNENSWVQSPCFDFSSLANPYIELKIWWNAEFSWDGAVLQSSIDGGLTWQNVGAFGDPNNWYNDNTIDGNPGGQQEGWTGRTSSSNGSNGWVTATHALSGLGGESDVILRIAFGSDGSIVDDGFAFDDIHIYDQPAIDLGLSAITGPNSTCNMGLDTITIVAFNPGIVDFSNAAVFYSLDGGALVAGSIPSVLAGQSVSYSFPVLGDFSAFGPHSIVAWISVPGDGNSSNDTVTTTVNNQTPISIFPYFEDFESGPGDWASGGNLSSWAFGTPAKTTINSAGSGVNSWVTGGLGTTPYNNNENSWVISPCFDFSSLVNPWIELKIWWNAEFSWDGAVLQSSIDGGATWQNVGAFGDPNNWYNDNTIDGNPGGQQEGWTGRTSSGNGSNGWVLAKNALSGLGGQASVTLRIAFGADGIINDDGFGFDDIYIYDQPAIDLAVVSIDGPASNCNMTATETISITVSNPGVVDFTNVSVFYSLNGGAPVAGSVPSVLAGQTVGYSFSAPADFSVPGPYNVVAWVSVPGDGDASNDTAMAVVTHIIPIDTYPFLEDFESGPAGWTSGGTASTWAFGTPAKTNISGAASGVNAWVTGGLGTGFYNNSENSWVKSPCFDFSSLSQPIVELDVWWNAEFSWDGAVLQTSIDGGLTWQNVGAFGDPNNWYNDNTINGNPGGSQEGWTGRTSTGNGSNGWVTAKNDLTGLGGQSSVIFRIAFGSDPSIADDGFAFDNFRVYDRPADDVGIAAILAPGTKDCGTNQSFVTFVVENYGLATQSNFPVRVRVTGAFTGTVNTTVPGPLAYGETDTITVGPLNTSAGGTYNFEVFTRLTGDQDNSNDTMMISTVYLPVTSDPVTSGDDICTPGPAMVTASSSNGNIDWFDASTGGNLLGTGDTLMLTQVDSTTIYYAEAYQGSTDNVGPVDNSIGGGGTYNFFGDGLVFNVQQDLTINKVSVFPFSTGDVTIRLLNSSNAVLATYTMTVATPNMFMDVPVGFNVPTGSGYRLDATGSTVTGLYRNLAGGIYPYTLPGYISITNAINNLAGYYYFFYNWEVSTKSCATTRVPATVNVAFANDVDLGSDTTICLTYRRKLDAGVPGASYLWSTGATTQVIYATTAGTYSVTVTSGTCSTSDSVTLTGGYCPSSGVSTSQQFLNSVCVGTLCHNGTGPNGGYGNFSAIQGKITLGANYILSLYPGGPNRNAYYRGWVDMNQNCEFEPNELIFTTAKTNSNLVQVVLNVPVTAMTGPARFRIQMGDTLVGPCDVIPFGEVHDYTLLLSVPYCTAGGQSTVQTWIQSVCLGTQCVNSGNNNGYAIFNTTVTIVAGTTLPFTLTPGYGAGDVPVYWAVYMDINNDGDYDDDGERLFYTNSPVTGVVNGTVTIPAYALNGNARLRFVESLDPISNACANQANGETEVYRIKISGGKNTRLFGSDLPGEFSDAQIEQPLSMTVYPNPANAGGQAFVVFNSEIEDAELFVTDLAGKTVYRISERFIPEGSPVILPLSQFSTGVYQVVIRSANGMATQKLVVTK